MDYPRYLRLMDAAGYDGHIVVEISLMVQRRPDFDPLAAATRSYRVLARGVRGGRDRAGTRREVTAMFVYVGAYTEEQYDGKAEGISVFDFDPETGSLTPVGSRRRRRQPQLPRPRCLRAVPLRGQRAARGRRHRASPAIPRAAP